VLGRQVGRRTIATIALAGAGALALPSAAAAREDVVHSFDETPIAISFFPARQLAEGERAPTVLVGHGWGGSRYDADDVSSGAGESLGPKPLLERGYNVLTWDARGFGESGGEVYVDSPEYEVRDTRRLITYVSRQPEAGLDGRRDPVVGMAGGSYGGGIQLNTAAIDERVDAIVPGIAWHSLITSLLKSGAVKGGWGSILYAVGNASGRLAPEIHRAFANGVVAGSPTEEDKRFFRSRGPGRRVRKIDAPTFLVQGTVDTLFTPAEAVVNYRLLRGAGTPVKMFWFCGGHGVCSTDEDSEALVDAEGGPRARRAALRWFDRHLRGERVGTGAGFRWFSEDGELRDDRDWPVQRDAWLRGEGSGSLALAPAAEPSGLPYAAEPAAVAVELPIEPPDGGGEVVGAPRLALTYSGSASQTASHAFAQLVDEERGVVVGNQVTPIPLQLDGEQRKLRLPLEIVASHANPGHRYTLQLIAATQVYGPQRSTGTVSFDRVTIRLPLAGSG
jgi:ABC-2 type transport system ATP-binding protein